MVGGLGGDGQPGGMLRNMTRQYGHTSGAGRSASMPSEIKYGRSKRWRKCPAGNEEHGKLVIDVRVCAACHAEPTDDSSQNRVWKHLPNDEDAEAAKMWWQSAAKRPDSCVRDVYVEGLSACTNGRPLRRKRGQPRRGNGVRSAEPIGPRSTGVTLASSSPLSLSGSSLGSPALLRCSSVVMS